MADKSDQTVVIVGAGHAGGMLAASLRQGKYSGRVVVVGEESYLPYQRPPLSKTYLAGEAALDTLYLKPAASYDKAQIELLPRTRVAHVDRQKNMLELDNGDALAYDQLALATGGRARRLNISGDALAHIYYLRHIDDVIAMQPYFQSGRRLVIIGGGYIGLEVASVAVRRGLKVTVLEAESRVLARVTAPQVSRFYEALHREAGVTIRTDAEVSAFEGDQSVESVVCADGSRIPADLVLVGIGLIPNTELAANAGLEVNDGIRVDEYARTSDPDIVAAGDCTNHPNRLLGRHIRLESVPNAMAQARTAAATLCGQEKPYQEVPWFWSDQYDLKLQMAGLAQDYDEVVLRGDPDQRSFAAFYLRNGFVVAVDAINRPAEFMAGKRLVSGQARVDSTRLADESIEPKSLIE